MIKSGLASGLAVSFLVSGAWVFSTTSASADVYVSCESHKQRRAHCPLNGEVVSVRLARQYSSSRCVQGRSWGYTNYGIWVDHGCRARFAVSYGRGGYGDNYSGGYGGDYQRNDGGDAAAGLLIGALILGAIAASDNDDDYRGGYNDYDDGYGGQTYGGNHGGRGGRQAAINACMGRADAYIRSDGGYHARLLQVYDVDRRRGGRYKIRGRLLADYGRRKEKCDFVCETDGYHVSYLDLR